MRGLRHLRSSPSFAQENMRGNDAFSHSPEFSILRSQTRRTKGSRGSLLNIAISRSKGKGAGGNWRRKVSRTTKRLARRLTCSLLQCWRYSLQSIASVEREGRTIKGRPSTNVRETKENEGQHLLKKTSEGEMGMQRRQKRQTRRKELETKRGAGVQRTTDE